MVKSSVPTHWKRNIMIWNCLIFLWSLILHGIHLTSKNSPYLFWQVDSISTKYCCNCSDEDGLASAEMVLRGLSLDPSIEDCIAVQRVCQIVSTRAAHLCAASLVAVLRQIRDNKAAERLRTTIGVDGSVYKNHQEWVMCLDGFSASNSLIT